MKLAAKPADSALARKLDRLMRWSQLSLLKLAQWIVQISDVWAPLEGAVQALLRPRLAVLTKIILALIVIKASRRITPPLKPRHYGPAVRPVGMKLRVLFGARLRKAARGGSSLHGDLRGRIAALMMLLEDAETQIAASARRLARGLTRLWGAVRELDDAEALVSPMHAAICVADTS